MMGVIKKPLEKFEFITKIGIPEALEESKLSDFNRRTFAKRCLYSDYRTLAVLEWHLHGDVPLYKQHLKTALRYERERFTEAHQKDPTIWYYCPYGEAITCLCTGDFHYAREFIIFLDDYNCPNYKHRRPWMYYILLSLVASRYGDKFDFHLFSLKKMYSTKKYVLLLPQISLIEAIRENDKIKFHRALEETVKAYKPSGIFYDWYEDRFLYLEAIALCNLALGRGMKVDFDHPFVPKALLGA